LSRDGRKGGREKRRERSISLSEWRERGRKKDLLSSDKDVHGKGRKMRMVVIAPRKGGGGEKG